MHRWLALALALGTLVLVACDRGGDGASPDASPTASRGTAAAAPSAACAPARPFAAGDSDQALRANDVDRTYILHVPPSYDGSRPLPLVISLHGYASNAQQQARYSNWSAKGDAEGFIVATPNATGSPQRWNVAAVGGVDDVGFIARLLDHLQATLCVDASRVYASGISNGAAMTARLACSLSDRLAAVAVVAGLFYLPGCDAAGPMPIVAFHGTADRLVPYEGGTTGILNVSVRSVESYAADWARHGGCDAEPARAPVTEHVSTIAYSACANDVAVVIYVVEGGGHTWPGAIDLPFLGETTHEISANDEAWRFFEAQAELRR